MKYLLILIRISIIIILAVSQNFCSDKNIKNSDIIIESTLFFVDIKILTSNINQNIKIMYKSEIIQYNSKIPNKYN